MAQVLQLRRGTTAQNDAFTGAVAEVSVDTDRKSLRVHDGSTVGGKEIADFETAVPLLPSAASVSGSDTVPVIQSGVARKATKTQILNGIVDANIDAAANISGTKLANSAVTTAKIADSNVTTAKIADSNVTTAKIADSNVTTAKIADSNVTTAKINNLAITSAKLAYDGGPMSGFRNRIINGNMQIDQRNAGAALTVSNSFSPFSVDRWSGSGRSSSGVFTLQQDSVAPNEFTKSLKITVTTADTNITSLSYQVQQPIESFVVSDLAFGTASAKTVTLSFWARSSLTGTFGGALSNSAFNRSYPFVYSISAANTWEYKTVTIAGDTTGTWIGATDGIGLRVYFGLGASTGRAGPAGAWAGAGYTTASGAVSVIGTLNATLYLAGVQLETGSVATPFEVRPIGTELALCQRYYQRNTSVGRAMAAGYAMTTTQGRYIIPFQTQMRVAPSILETTGTASNYRIFHGNGITQCNTVPAWAGSSVNEIEITATVASGLVAGQGSMLGPENLVTAYLGWSAELI